MTWINALFARSRNSRGCPNYYKSCRARYSTAEPPNHKIQHCFRTHAVRAKRHDSIMSYVIHNLEQRGSEAILDPFTVWVWRCPSQIFCRRKETERSSWIPKFEEDRVDIQQLQKTKVATYVFWSHMSHVFWRRAYSESRKKYTLPGVWSEFGCLYS